MHGLFLLSGTVFILQELHDRLRCTLISAHIPPPGTYLLADLVPTLHWP